MSLPSATLLIQMSGAPGSGKSTISRLLRQRIGGVVIDHDVLRSAALESDILSFGQAAKQAYSLQWKLVQDFMEQRVGIIIVDSPCNYAEAVERGTSLAAQHEYEYWYVECKVDDMDLLDRRMRARRPMPSQRSAINCPPAAAQRTGPLNDEEARARFARWMKSPIRPENESCIISVDSTGSSEVICEQIQKRLSLANPETGKSSGL